MSSVAMEVSVCYGSNLKRPEPAGEGRGTSAIWITSRFTCKVDLAQLNSCI